MGTHWSVRTDEVQQGGDDALSDDVIPTLGAISGDVPQRPHGLLAHVGVLGGQQRYQQGHRTTVHHCVGLLGVARGNVGEGPRCLELEERAATCKGQVTNCLRHGVTCRSPDVGVVHSHDTLCI